MCVNNYVVQYLCTHVIYLLQATHRTKFLNSQNTVQFSVHPFQHIEQKKVWTCLKREPGGSRNSFWGCTAPLTADGHVLTLDSVKGAWRILNSCLRMYCSLNSWWTCAYLGLGEWSLKDFEQLLKDVLLPQQLMAMCLPWTRWMEPEGFWTAAWGCTALPTAGGHVLTLDSVNGAWRILNSCLRMYCSRNRW